MPQRSAPSRLPPEVREWLDRELIRRNFSGYRALENELRAKGFRASHSSIHRYAQGIQALQGPLLEARRLAIAVGDEAMGMDIILGSVLKTLNALDARLAVIEELVSTVLDAVGRRP